MYWTVDDPLPDDELRVWLDDLLDDRAAPDGWVHVTTAPAAIALLETGRVVELSLDHDLGDDDLAGKGVHVVDHIAEQQMLYGRDLWPRDGITIHSANPAGRDQMARAIERYAGELHRVRRTVTTSGKPHFRFSPLAGDTPAETDGRVGARWRPSRISDGSAHAGKSECIEIRDRLRRPAATQPRPP